MAEPNLKHYAERGVYRGWSIYQLKDGAEGAQKPQWRATKPKDGLTRSAKDREALLHGIDRYCRREAELKEIETKSQRFKKAVEEAAERIAKERPSPSAMANALLQRQVRDLEGEVEKLRGERVRENLLRELLLLKPEIKVEVSNDVQPFGFPFSNRDFVTRQRVHVELASCGKVGGGLSQALQEYKEHQRRVSGGFSATCLAALHGPG